MHNQFQHLNIGFYESYVLEWNSKIDEKFLIKMKHEWYTKEQSQSILKQNKKKFHQWKNQWT